MAGRTGDVKRDGTSSGRPSGNVAVARGVGEVSSNEEARLLTPLAGPAVLKKGQGAESKTRGLHAREIGGERKRVAVGTHAARGRGVEQTVEGYRWGGARSGGRKKTQGVRE